MDFLECKSRTLKDKLKEGDKLYHIFYENDSKVILFVIGTIFPMDGSAERGRGGKNREITKTPPIAFISWWKIIQWRSCK